MPWAGLSPEEEKDVAALRTRLEGKAAQIDANLTQHGEEGLTQATLVRWLKARKWDVKHAAKDLEEHAAWRAAYISGALRVADAEVEAELGRNIAFLMGSDKKLHPSVLVIGCNHVPQDVERTKRFIAYTLDAAVHWGHLEMARVREEAAAAGVPVEREWDGKAVGVFDLSNFGWSNADLNALKAVFDMLQNHYVERLYKLYLYSAPTIFYGLWKVLYPLIDPKSREKVVFVEKSNALKKMCEHFEPEALAPCVGGTFTPIGLRDVWKSIEARNPGLEAALSTPDGAITNAN